MSINERIIHNVSVDCVVFGYDNETLKVLLIEQKALDEKAKKGKGAQFALPGDLVREDEGLHQAATRVLGELTQLQGIYLKQFHTYGNPGRVSDVKDAEWLKTYRSNPETRVITVAYYSLVNLADYEPGAGSFAKRSVWIDMGKEPRLAFDHNKILQGGLDMLRDELINKNIGFELLPEKFTLSQLQSLYEIVLDKKLDKRNFRKSIKKIDQLKPLDEKQKGVLHKPAQLYKYEGIIPRK